MSNLIFARRSRSALAFALAAGLALGLSSSLRAEPGGGKGASPSDQPLRGPRADEHRAPGTEGAFGTGERRPRDRPDMRAFHEAMMGTLGPEAPADLRASEDQHQKIKAIMSGFREQMHAYMDQHKGELAAIRPKDADAQRRRAPRDANPPPSAGNKPGAPSPDAQASRDKLRQIMENAPKPDAAINQVWQVLSPAQKQAVEHRLAEVQSEHAKDRRDRVADRKGGPDGQQPQRRRPGPARGRPGPDDAPGADDDGPPDGPHARFDRSDRPGSAPPSPERIERLRAMIDRLSPEERRALMDQLSDRRMGPPPRHGPDAPNRGFRGAPPRPAPPPPRPEFDPPEHELSESD